MAIPRTRTAIPYELELAIQVEASAWPRVTLSPDGRWLTAIDAGALVEVDLDAGSVRRGRPALAAIALDDETWTLARGDAGWRIATARHGEDADGGLDLDGLGVHPVLAARAGAGAIVQGTRAFAVQRDGRGWATAELPAGPDRSILIGPRSWIERQGGSLWLRRPTGDLRIDLGGDLATASVVGGGPLGHGIAAAIELRGPAVHVLAVIDLRRGTPLSRLRLDGIVEVALIAARNQAVLRTRDGRLSLLDLHKGRCLGELALGDDVIAIATDAVGAQLAIGRRGDGVERWTIGGLDERIGPRLTLVPAVAAPAAPEPEAAPTPVVAPAPVPRLAPAPAAARLPPVRELPALLPRFAELAPAALQRHLDVVHTWVAAGSARLAAEQRGAEVAAASRAASADATDRLDRELESATPIGELMRDTELSRRAGRILLAIAAPQLWGELGRGPIDELLLGQVLGAGLAERAAVAAELDDDAPLLRHGLVIAGAGRRPFRELSVPDPVARRLAGHRFAVGAGDGVLIARDADRALDRIVAPVPPLARLLGVLGGVAAQPARIALVGTRGAGRRTIAAALAARAGRRLGVIDAAAVAADEVARKLRDAWLRGWLPCVSVPDGDPAALRALQAVLDRHPGPLLVRVATGAPVPLAPGHHTLELPPLELDQRRACWQRELGDHRATGPADQLAVRFEVGPGTIARIATELAGASGDDLLERAAERVRQHRVRRIGAIAERVTRLATRDQLVLTADAMASIDEVVGRIEHRRTVLDGWGLGKVVGGARGVIALFQGDPGTGKTLAAGAIAHELGFELYRVDLSRVISKWIGETEKNLAEVFAAAEEGEVVLLFDEADSLFAKRTEVRSSNDRNANLEVNYLLQRLDTFDGVAILTTNFGTAIDRAFQRRLSARVTFPFPDVDARERLWRVHLAAGLPVAGDVDLRDLAERFELSGGYIRNAAVRAAFLAAARARPLAQDDLLTAVQLEYRDAGKIHQGGRLA